MGGGSRVLNAWWGMGGGPTTCPLCPYVESCLMWTNELCLMYINESWMSNASVMWMCQVSCSTTRTHTHTHTPSLSHTHTRTHLHTHTHIHTHTHTEINVDADVDTDTYTDTDRHRRRHRHRHRHRNTHKYTSSLMFHCTQCLTATTPQSWCHFNMFPLHLKAAIRTRDRALLEGDHVTFSGSARFRQCRMCLQIYGRGSHVRAERAVSARVWQKGIARRERATKRPYRQGRSCAQHPAGHGVAGLVALQLQMQAYVVFVLCLCMSPSTSTISTHRKEQWGPNAGSLIKQV